MDFCSINVSGDSVTHSAWSTASEEESESTAIGYAYATLALIFFIVGVPMNVFVFIVIIGRHLWKSVPMILMLNLTVSNTATCIFILPFVIVSGYSTEYVFGSSDYIRCGFCSFGIFNLCLALVDEYTIAFMSVERLLYLKLPLKYESVVTPRRAVVVILLIWIICILLSIPPLVGYGEVVFLYKIANCASVSFADGKVTYNITFGVFVGIIEFLSLLIVVISYLWIVVIARSSLFKNADHCAHRSESQVSADLSEESKQLKKEYHKKQFRMVQLLGLIFGVNAITWVPFIVLELCSSMIGPFAIPIFYYFFSYSIYLSAVLIYPILQTSLTYEIKEAVLQTLKKVF